MQQNSPPELPVHAKEPPGRPAVVRRLPPSLPDPGSVRRLEIPDSAPPYDGEQDGAAAAFLPLLGLAPPGGEAEPDGRPGHASGSGEDGGAGGPGGGTGAGGWPSQFAQVLAETLAGARPARQLTPWTTEQTRQRIRQLGPMLATGQRPKVRRIMTSAPSRDVIELTAVVGFGPRVRVLALRLERAGEPGQRWRCTAIESA
jgi:hypothetical protein